MLKVLHFVSEWIFKSVYNGLKMSAKAHNEHNIMFGKHSQQGAFKHSRSLISIKTLAESTTKACNKVFTVHELNTTYLVWSFTCN